MATLNISSIANTYDKSSSTTLTYLHYHLNTASNSTSLAKRDQSRLMNQCLGLNMQGKVYAWSNCRPWDNIQAVTVICEQPHKPYLDQYSLQSCASSEICVEIGVDVRFRQAWCVSTHNFVAFAETHTQGLLPHIEVPLLDKESERLPKAASLMLTDESHTKPIQSGVVFMDAVGPDFVSARNVATSHGKVVGSRRCQHCSRLLFQPLPLDAKS